MEGLVVKFAEAFRGRRVLVTGHTGFKGGWLSLWLQRLGAEVHGFSLPPPTIPNLFTELSLGDSLKTHTIGDVRDPGALEKAIAVSKPEIVFHLAAQPIVRRSYREPRDTWETNVIGTINVLEAIRQVGGVHVAQVITSDKCYENGGQVCAFRETDPMGGHDPYSSSKGAAEIAVAAWRRSYFPPAQISKHGLSLASVRAGNVIGGGDWAEDRLIPDCIRALSDNLPITIRNPHAVRPWQHVLEPLAGYLTLAARQLDEPETFADAFNFGPLPSGNMNVGKVADIVVKTWGGGRWAHHADTNHVRDPLHEAAFLKLDVTKATTLLDWSPIYTSEDAIRLSVEWYRNRHDAGKDFDARTLCLEQIAQYGKTVGQR